MQKLFKIWNNPVTGQLDKDGLIRYFRDCVPTSKQDKVVVYIEVQGWKDGKFQVKNFVQDFYPAKGLTAIEITTALGALVWIDWLEGGGATTPYFKDRYFIKQEDMPFDAFKRYLGSHYNKVYNQPLLSLPDLF
jgi:saccharopine dehydrogenase-like NADP-dependent oxidoreductase